MLILFLEPLSFLKGVTHLWGGFREAVNVDI